MRNLLSTLFLLIIVSPIFAQQNHFIYLQTENRQPFYVKFDGRVYNSSSNGYVILSKIPPGDYKIEIGFAKRGIHEQIFNCSVDKSDLGFLIKNYGDRGWGFYNLQTQDVLMAGEVAIKKPDLERQTSDDPFSNMLANVVHDTAINQKEEVPEPNTVAAVNNSQVEGSVDSTMKRGSDTSAFRIRKTVNRKIKSGIQLVYIDINENGRDTIHILVPAELPIKKKPLHDTTRQVQVSKLPGVHPKSIAIKHPVKHPAELHKDSTNANVPAARDSVAIQLTAPEAKTENVVKTDIPEIRSQVPDTKPVMSQPGDSSANDPSKATSKSGKEENTITVPDNSKAEGQNKEADANLSHAAPDKPAPVMINSDCKAVASDVDFLKLRKRMVLAKNDEYMLRVAKKAFKVECFTTEQIKNLTALFLHDEGKYLFLEAAYPYVPEIGTFPGLESLLTDPYYVKRFRAMVHN